MKKLPVIPTLTVLFFVILMTNMGFWQIRRAHEKEQIMELLADDSLTKITKKSQLKNLPKYANIELQGHYLNQPQLLLDNQVNQGEQGFHVFTPFVVDGLNINIMVNRGWLAKKTYDKNSLIIETNTQTIKGKLNTAPQVGIQIGEIELQKNKNQQIITYYDEDKLSDFLHAELCHKLDCLVSAKILLLDENQKNGFKREWKPVIMLPSKHIAYAVQWFAMTFVLIIIFIYWLRKSKFI